MRPDERQQLANDFARTINLSPDDVLRVSDRIQHNAKARPDLVAQCKFGRSIQVRRLKTQSHKHWNGTDWAAARAIVDEIAYLQKQPPSTGVVLSLAVLGVSTDTLDDALAVLEERELMAAPVAADEGQPQGHAQAITTRPERQSGQRKK
jgi:hypothetical protein